MDTIFSPHMLGSCVVLAVQYRKGDKGTKGFAISLYIFFLLSSSSLCLFSKFLFTFHVFFSS